MKEQLSDRRYEAACSRIRHLLQHWLESGVDLFIALREVEVSGDWRLGGHAAFSDFLIAEFPNALGFDRYQSVIRAVDVYGLAFVKSVGVHCAVAMSSPRALKNPESVALVKERVRESMSATGRPPEVPEVKRIVSQVSYAAEVKDRPPPKLSPATHGHPRLRVLRPIQDLQEQKKEIRIKKDAWLGDTAIRELNDWLARYRSINDQGPVRPIWNRVRAALEDQRELDSRNK